MSWRDDLPEIPSDRIRSEAIHAGAQRRRAARERRRNLVVGGIAVAIAVFLVGGALSLLPRDSGFGDDDAASTDTGAAAATTAASGTDAPAATEAGSATTAAGSEETTGETAPEGTEATGATAAVDPTVRVEPAGVWEQPDEGAPCGPTRFTVMVPLAAGETAARVRWPWPPFVVEAPMVVADGLATATIGPFPTGTLAPGGRLEEAVVVVVTDDSGGTRTVRGPVVELSACPG